MDIAALAVRVCFDAGAIVEVTTNTVLDPFRVGGRIVQRDELYRMADDFAINRAPHTWASAHIKLDYIDARRARSISDRSS